MFGPEDNFEIEREPDKRSEYDSKKESDGYSVSKKTDRLGGYRDIVLDDNEVEDKE